MQTHIRDIGEAGKGRWTFANRKVLVGCLNGRKVDRAQSGARIEAAIKAPA